MPRYRTSVLTSQPPETVFGYMAAFDNVVEWDPGTVGAERLGTGPLTTGSEFRVVVAAAGREFPLTYRITEFDPPRRVVLEAESVTLRSIDRITVRPEAEGSTVSYDAQVDLLGPLRILNPAFGLAFRRTGDRAAAGLRRKLAP